MVLLGGPSMDIGQLEASMGGPLEAGHDGFWRLLDKAGFQIARDITASR